MSIGPDRGGLLADERGPGDRGDHPRRTVLHEVAEAEVLHRAGGWHAPLFATGDVLLPDVLVILAASVVVGAVFHAGRDSVLIAMLLHATNNAVGGSYASQLFDGHDRTTLGLVTAAGWWVIAGGILVRARRRREQTLTPLPRVVTAGTSSAGIGPSAMSRQGSAR